MPARTRKKTHGRIVPVSSGARVAVREQHRQQRRQAVIDAAREVFYETHYVLAKVEDILQRAGISRPTFYRYFPDKDAVLREIMIEDVTAQSALWKEIATLGRPAEPQLVAWARRFLKGMRRKSRSVSLFNVACGLDTTLVHEFSLVRDRSMAMLGEGIAAFRMTGDGSRRDRERRAAAHLLFYELDQLCFNCVFPGADLDENAMITAWARNFLRFSAEFGKD
ncbi:MAG: TetR/AcrR family transcriptional regulator [Gammaproteobacteria bacterium]